MNNRNRISDSNSESARAAFAGADGRKLVYIRAVLASEVMEDLESEFDNASIELPADAVIYSVHDEDGERLALVGDRELAFAAARQYEMTPVSVH